MDSTSPSLISARTAPPLSPQGTVVRRDVLRLLDGASDRRLTVVSAGPGWGKTTVVADWARRLTVPVAWLTLERADDSSAVFWGEVLQALMRGDVVPPDHPLRDLDPAGSLSSGLLRALFRGIESLPDPVLLVLDDFHVVQSRDVLEAVEALVRYDLPLHLVLVTRVDPALHLHRLRLDGRLVEVSADALAFGPDEVRELASGEGVDLTAEDVGLLLERTEGWPAGVRLAMMYLTRPGTDRDLAGFAGDDRSVAEYLLGEVLERQPASVRRLLQRTSVASPVSVELAEVLAPGADAAGVLDQLVRDHQFVTSLDPRGRWFRYHPLLRRMLVTQLRRDDPEGFRDAHRRAARWLLSRGEPVEALEHAAAAEDWAMLADLVVEGAAATVTGKQRHTVVTLLDRIPYQDLPPSAPVELCAAIAAISRGRFTAARLHGERARRLLEDADGAVHAAAALLVGIVEAAAARAAGDSRGTVTAGLAAVRTADETPLPYPALEPYRAIAKNQLGVGLLWTGDTAGARRAFADVLAASIGTGIELAALNAHAYLAVCDLVDDELGRAEALALEALDLAQPRGWTSHLQLRMAHLVVAMVRVLRGDVDGADLALAPGQSAVVGGGEPPAVLYGRLVQVFVAVSRGRLRAAELALSAVRDAQQGWDLGDYLSGLVQRAETEVQLLTARVLGAPAVPADTGRPVDVVERVCLARVLLAAGDAVGAGESVDPVTWYGAAGDADLLTQVEAWLVRALSAHHLRRDRDALDALGRAVELARPQRLVRPFLVMADERLASLLQLLDGIGLTSDDFLRALSDSVAGEGGVSEAEPEPLLVPLTDRELAMLAALPTMQSNAEIAAGFFVSVNTVKAHLKALYRKLDVGSRREAVRRGRELGLLP